jgi:hypothetical protein
MAYGLHIERESAIELAEWQSAVNKSDDVRLEKGENSATNPATGESIVVPALLGTAAVHVNGQWFKVFRWHKGKVTFNAPASTSSKDPVMAAALALASALSAVICGDEGEVYDGSL